MKKLKTLLTTALISLFAFCMFAFVGCGGNASEIAGSYKLCQLDYDGQTWQLGQVADGALVTEDTVTVELGEDGSMVWVMNAVSPDGEIIDSQTMSGSWEETDDGLSFNFGRYKATGSYEDGYLSIGIEGMATYTFTKE